MNLTKLRALLPIMTAWAAGQTIQNRSNKERPWIDISPKDNVAWSLDVENYRIKPTPRKIYEIRNRNDGVWMRHVDEADALKDLHKMQTTGNCPPYTLVSYTEDLQ